MEGNELHKITQEGTVLHILFDRPDKVIHRIFVKNEFDSIEYDNASGSNHFKINLLEVAEHFKSQDDPKIYIIVEESTDILTTQRTLKVFNEDFEVENLSAVVENNCIIYPYITKNGFLHLSMSDYVPSKIYFSRRHIDSLKMNNRQAQIDGQFAIINSHLTTTHLLIKTRFTDREKRIAIVPQLNGNNKNAATYDFSADIYDELIEFMQYPYDSGDIIDIFLEIQVQEVLEPIKYKLGNPRILAERFLKGEIITEYNNEIISITPYFTMKGRNLSFRINRYSIESYLQYINNIKKTNIHHILKKEQEKIWVIGEKSYKAQDNGYHFFKYMRTHYPERPVYYVIEESSKEAEHVLPLGNVIFYKTPEHFDIMLQADYICSTHHPELLYPTNSQIYTRKIKAIKVFLQHGVLGTKNLSQINGNQLKDFNVDLFVTSSEREKEIVVRDLKFDNNQVVVTGLARFDELFNPDNQVKNQLLIIPTWRDWLINSEQLIESDYLSRINALLYSSKIKEVVDQGIEVIFCLHPNMQPFIDLFDVPPYVTCIRQGDVDVQQLIKESKLMITDYSSVAFDFGFLYKPVIYYQFDKERFLGKDGSHIDIEQELPGVIVNSLASLEQKLSHYVNHNFEVEDEIKARANQFIKYRDQHNSCRIYKAVSYFKAQYTLKNKVKYDIVSQHLFKRFRKNKYYFKTMDKYNSVVSKVLPTKKDLIVFESNVGKTVGDSPKVIYDTLKQYHHHYDIVWVTNQDYPFNDPHVTTVERLSPEYFHYLSRAKYWINNQNFPYYLAKPKDTIYIQTWHGTPLKKMLNDVDTFEGRDEGYKDRVNQAIKNWDYLISPSPYASKCFKSAFNFKKEILEIGYPRNDIFYSNNEAQLEVKKKMIKQKLGIKDQRKVILYAPTFRDDDINKAKKHIIKLHMDLQKMKENFEEEYILILRPHIIISNALHLDASLDEFVINASAYDDISDLYLITDICITDYSSVMFDFANTKKPMLFFTYDLDYYKNQLRGFYFDFEQTAPGPLVRTNDELIDAIKRIETVREHYGEKYDAFYERFCRFETGHAAEAIVKRFFLN